MNHVLVLACIATLTACASGPQSDSSWQSNQALPLYGAPSVIADGQADQFKDQILGLREQRLTLVNNLPRVGDPNTRADHIRSINKMDEQIRYFEYQLRAAGRQIP